MAVDMHEHRFIEELEKLPRFYPLREGVDPTARAIDFPAWRALFTSLAEYGHSTGYRLPSFEEFFDYCRRAFTHVRHGGRFERHFAGSELPRTLDRIRFWYESGMAETYLYVCLVDAFEDHLRDGIVLYDPRADWKLKFDVAVFARDKKFAINAYWGDAAARSRVEAYRDNIERERKVNTAGSAHWDNQERERWIELAIDRSERNCQTVRGVRLFSIASINRLISQVCAEASISPFVFPTDLEERKRLGQSLFRRPR